MEEIIKVIIDNLVEIITLTVMSLMGMAVAKVKAYIKAKTTNEQYMMLEKVSRDVYEYVEREFGDKLKEHGALKLQRAMEVFDAQMKKHNLPYTAVDFKMQVEKIIREEKAKQ